MNKLKQDLSIAVIIATLGFVGWNAGPYGFAVLVLLPALWLQLSSRKYVFLAMLGYYVAATKEVPFAAYQFFEGDLLRTIAYWLAQQVILATGWVFLWQRRTLKFTDIAARCAGTFGVLAFVPPYALLGTGHPITAAGYYFPGTGFVGLLLYFLCSVTIAYLFVCRDRAGRSLGVTTITVCAAFHILLSCTFQSRSMPKGWVAVDLILDGMTNDYVGAYNRHLELQELARDRIRDGYKVVLFPESIAGKWSVIEERLWQPVQRYAHDNGAVILLGVQYVGSSYSTNGTVWYDNAMVVIGEPRLTSSRIITARVPMPVANFNPFADRSARINISPWNDGTVQISGITACVLVCFEGLTVLPVIQSFSTITDRPDIIIAPAGMWWIRAPSRLPQIMANTINLWSRLFSVPLIRPTTYSTDFLKNKQRQAPLTEIK